MTVARIILKSDDPTPVLVEGVQVRVFDTNGSLVTTGSTDGSGEVSFDLPDADYDLYFYKHGVSVVSGSPQRITVDVADVDVPPNTYEVIVHIHTLAEAVDPTLCRVSGTVIGLDGKGSKDGKLVFGLVRESGVYQGKVVAPQSQLAITPDADGRYEFDLLRGAKYSAYFYMLDTLFRKEPPKLDVIVPDLAALPIQDLLFPVPTSAVFGEETLALSVNGDEDDSVSYTINYSDGSSSDERSPPLFVAISVSSDNESVATVELHNGKLLVTPVGEGTATIIITRDISNDIIYTPEPSFSSGSLVVTVS